MLEEVDSIDWNAVGAHVYGKNETIPARIREVLSDDAATREHALGFLLGDQQDSGDIYDTTPIIMRFLFEVLAAAPLPVKAELIERMIGPISTTQTSADSINHMRNFVATYDLFKAHLPLLEELLYSPETGIRLDALAILAQMKEELKDVQPMLLEYFQNGPAEEECVAIIGALKSLWWGRWALLDWNQDLDEAYHRFLEATLAAHPLPVVRVAAARALAYRLGGYQWRATPLLQTVSAMLADEFFAHSVRFDSEDYRPTHTRQIVQEIAHLYSGAEVLDEILKKPALTPDQAHLLGRAMLARDIIYSEPQQTMHWQHYPLHHKGEGTLYGFPTYRTGAIRGQVRSVLERLVDRDMFWQAPTNLLSFFYGLPDDRAELRALLEAR